MAKAKKNLIGSWAFLVGVVLAVVLGVLAGMNGNAISQPMLLVLVVIGLVVGFLNVTSSEAAPFLMSGAVLIIASTLGQAVMVQVAVVSSVLNALLAIFVPATVIVAVKNVFMFAKN